MADTKMDDSQERAVVQSVEPATTKANGVDASLLEDTPGRLWFHQVPPRMDDTQERAVVQPVGPETAKGNGVDASFLEDTPWRLWFHPVPLEMARVEVSMVETETRGAADDSEAGEDLQDFHPDEPASKNIPLC